MKRVVALLLIASVALFAAVAPQSDLKVKAGAPREAEQTVSVKAAPLQVVREEQSRSLKTSMMKAPAITIDTNEVTLIYLEDFEDGAPGWTQYDGTAPDPLAEWHLTDSWTPGDSLWWCGDPAIGGYWSHWLVALETPVVQMTGPDSILSFDLMMFAEGLADYEGYDGWDGGNVWVSGDGGETWDIAVPTGVPYNAESLFSFGSEFNMGLGIPGWGGQLAGDVEINLAEFMGDSVIVRFVFSSDPMTDGSDTDSLFGMFIDSVDVAGNAVYNGSSADGLKSMSLNMAMGAFWAVEARTDSLPSGTHALRNWDPSDTTYAVGLEDYFVSPVISIPDEPATLVYCDFEFYPDFYDDDAFPNVDFWRLEVSPDYGTNWYAISNPYGGSDPNYVYSDGLPFWVSFRAGYDEPCDLTDYKGMDLMFRFYFHSDLDTPMGGGLMIDDFVVYSQPDLPVPTGVAAAMNVDDNVAISWDDMDGTYPMDKLFMATDTSTADLWYGPGYTYWENDSTTGFGLGSPYSTGGKDMNFTSIDFAVYNSPYYYGDSMSVAVIGVDTSLHVLYWSDNFCPDSTVGFQMVDISSEGVTWNGDFWVMAFWESSPFYPPCYLPAGSGVKIYYPGVGFYNDGASATPIGARGYSEVTYSGLEYNVYRRPVASTTMTKLNATPLATTSFVDETADPFTEYAYYVVCTADDFEGGLSLGAALFVTPGDVEERKYDDGEADAVFELGMDTTVVVKLTPTSYPAKLEAVRFNALWAGDIYKIKIFKDNSGMPGDSWMLIEPPITAIKGWNAYQVITLLTMGGNGVVLEEGESVWVGVKGATPGDYPAWLGADTDGFSGMATMQVPGGGWSSIMSYLRCNPMIRGYFDTDIDMTAVPEVVPAKYELAQNYPNPFNPVTTIHFELKETGMTKVEIFDITGRHVRTLLNSNVEAGGYDLRFDASALSSGVYFYRLTSGSFTDIKKMSLVK